MNFERTNIMKKKIKINNLDCAACAAKIEEGLSKIDGVNKVSVSFISQKIILEAEDDKMDQILKEAVEITAKIEPDAQLVI